ncbi:MAG: DoxX family protein [Phycisphaerae bacterium]|nr:DoxX family protein [Gemmatimonadaceae bacterium]
MSAGTMSPSAPSRRTLHLTLWVAQVLLAAAFAVIGFTKLTQPMATLDAQFPWLASAPATLVRCIGMAELAGAVELVLPPNARIRPRVAPLAALGLAVIMALATAFHLSRGDDSALPITAVLGLLAVCVAWGRGKTAPVTPRDH